MRPNRDEKKWVYACQNCGTPYTSKPKFCCDCESGTIVPLAVLQNSTDDSGD
jgi:rRNA maturation endonuclease Nob1